MTLEQVGQMATGQVLEIVSDCSSALINIPAEIARHGHRLIGRPDQRGADFTLFVEVGGALSR